MQGYLGEQASDVDASKLMLNGVMNIRCLS